MTKKQKLRDRIAELESELANARDEAQMWQRLHEAAQKMPYFVPAAPPQPTWPQWPLGPTICQTMNTDGDPVEVGNTVWNRLLFALRS